ncbi:serine hydrolase domain-containing protein [Gemmatimonas phototrophica]|uniref:Beta-lactamase n=1 Tax=Gemmatimonas phototrophica TaxID=1379270 RepID=A0A143BNP4_9BACT|nr:serine hydrolase [Gemmatimonas phototrophica]AMW06081.1 beta-lactamase [Gemmatimonas phototrophica]
MTTVRSIGYRVVGATTLVVGLASPASAQKKSASVAPYVPPAGSWERRAPSAVGMDSAKLADAVAFAISKESKTPRDLELNHLQSFGREPLGDAIGPLPPRGVATGIVVRRGYVVATWGDPEAEEITNSVTKSFVSTVVGLAVDEGRIRSVHDTVAKYVPPIVRARPNGTAYSRDWPGTDKLLMPFDTPHNKRLTWDHLLRQVSDWEGTLWGKPEWADRPAQNAATWTTRPRVEPGSAYEYNDTRVNVLALAALQVWRRPLPEVLKERIMDPIGASNTWRWYGYDNSWIVLDGREVQSVSGGGHWGGGMVLNAWDMARFGLLTQRRGLWGDKRLLSDAWVTQALTPTPAQKTYGYMNWFVNPDRSYLAAAPPEAFVHVGAGNNFIYVDPVNDVVAVIRWMDTTASLNGFVARLLGSLR